MVSLFNISDETATINIHDILRCWISHLLGVEAQWEVGWNQGNGDWISLFVVNYSTFHMYAETYWEKYMFDCICFVPWSSRFCVRSLLSLSLPLWWMAENMPPSLTDGNLDGPHPLNITACVTFYIKSQSLTAKGKKSKTNTTKETWAKEFTHIFTTNKPNYLKFLQVILDIHHLLKYKAADITDQVVFLCKAQVPPAMYVTFLSLFSVLTICYSSKSDATYVINFDEFKALATKVKKKTISQPIIVSVEMPDIEKVFSKVSTAKICPC